MMHIVFTVCAGAAPDSCEARSHSFVPALPVACIHAAGPELDRVIPDGWRLAEWRCVAADAPLPARWAHLAPVIGAAAQGRPACSPPAPPGS